MTASDPAPPVRPKDPDAASALDEPLLSAAELRGRAKVGVAVIASRSVVVRGLTLAGYVALARLLAPSDFGLIAFGLTVVTLVTFVADAGIGAGLVRRREPPERADLQAMSALQLLISLPIAAVTALAAIPIGSAALVTAVMVSSLPLIALRTPGYITLSRRLAYKQLAVVEITETIVYVAWSVGGAALGAGVWAMATGAVARAIAGVLVMARVSPHGMLLPRWSTNRVRPMLAFGARFQAGQLTLFARDHGINVATFAIAGLSTLGLWSVIGRLMQVPFMLFEAVGTVAFPTLSRLGDTGEDLRPTLERGLRLMALATALVLVPLMASAPALVPSVFGAVWASGASIIPIASLGLLVSGPLSVVAIGYLLAAGDAATPLRAGVVNAIAYFGVALPLLPSMGVQALALGWATASLTEAAVLGRATNRRSGARVVAALAAPAALAAVIGVSGYLITDDLPPTLLTAVASATASLGAFVIAMLVLARRDLMSLAHLMTSLRTKSKPATA